MREMVDEPELMPLLPVIQGLMRFLPSKGISADEALRLLSCWQASKNARSRVPVIAPARRQGDVSIHLSSTLGCGAEILACATRRKETRGPKSK